MTLVRTVRPIRSFASRFLRGAGFGAMAVTISVGVPLGFTLTWAALEPRGFSETLHGALDVIDPVAPLLEEPRLYRVDNQSAFAGFPAPKAQARDRATSDMLASAEE